ncbi:ABC transporter ATP-binding protein [Qingshengfaniella alkalisoli]|uniref:ABC transporter ATP-binding protein n=1 Tax=Qingshengfaniella alkalisoli TaxID=2599296 RepID=A0A5B8ISR5_9RHOB|nr:ABC transporter ATP-binding protein [Qingshengfaniella alkalisoli]QDY68473.1 ABC transporter ATP-binding protein [Qingshengfaniella alkalisoli]
MSLVETRNLRVDLGGRNVLPDLSLMLPEHKITVIVGPNACGKSTLLRTMARLVKPAAGTAYLDDKDVHDQPSRDVARKLGLLPQQTLAPEGLSVRRLVERGRTPHLGPLRPMRESDRKAVDDALDSVGMRHNEDRPVAALSGGQRQRAWLALVLAQQTDVLLLDEPTTYLDLPHQIELLDLVKKLNHDTCRTVAMVLHDINLASRVADHMIALRGGAVVAQGSPSNVVTEAGMKAVFDLDCRVISDPCRGTPMVVPL